MLEQGGGTRALGPGREGKHGAQEQLGKQRAGIGTPVQLGERSMREQQGAGSMQA